MQNLKDITRKILADSIDCEEAIKTLTHFDRLRVLRAVDEAIDEQLRWSPSPRLFEKAERVAKLLEKENA